MSDLNDPTPPAGGSGQDDSNGQPPVDERVSDLAHRETAYQFRMVMKRIKKPIAERIRSKKVLCILIGHAEFTSQLPQFGTDKTGKYLDLYYWRNRGFLTRKGGRPTVVFAEEDVME